LDSRVIWWHILEDGICLVELFGGISSDLTTVLQSSIKVHQYYYVDKDPQIWQTSMHHIMMLQQQHSELLPASTIHGYKRTLSNNIILLGAQDLDMIEPMDLVISRWSC
jgi:hypothetical protein